VNGAARAPRSFVALMLDEPAGARLAREADAALAGASGLARTHALDLHVTLFFLGALDASWAPGLERGLTALRAPAPEFALTHFGAFPGRERPRILWAGVADGDAARLGALEARVRAACVGLGFRADERPFRPHVTVARVRPGGRLPEKVFDREFEVRARPAALALVESDRSGSGRAYRVRRSFSAVDAP
jgi:2'-5' RNA ligase